jgi:hypothetical protein
MKKSKAIELLKAQTHSIKMDRREEQDVQLLNEILGEVCPKDSGYANGNGDFYFIRHNNNFNTWHGDSDNPKFGYINISEIEVDDEFVNGEEVEGSHDVIHWSVPLFYVGKGVKGNFICQQNDGFTLGFNHIRKPQTERAKAIQTIKELKDKFNIKNEEV